MRAPARLIAAAASLALLTGGCAGPTPETASPQNSAFEPQAVRENRLAGIAWRLAVSNADICPLTRPSAGWVLQSASQYSGEMKRAAEIHYGLQGDLPGVLVAPDDSPAARAGLAPGDLIMAVNGERLAVGRETAEGSYEGLMRNAARLNDATASGSVVLDVRSEGEHRQVSLHPVPACAYHVELYDGGGSMVTRQGVILISERMERTARTDDELAFVVAHELSHLVLEHDRGPAVRGERGASNQAITLRRGRFPGYEADADRMALYLLARAGYDARAAADYLTRETDLGPSISLASGAIYKSPRERRRALEPVIEDIAARRAAGLALIP